MLPRDFGSHPLTWVVHQTLGVASREECKLMNLLPPSVLAELLLLEKRFWTDWEAVRQYLDGLPELSQLRRTKGVQSEMILDFMWGWINVNTRCLYDDLGLEKDDNMSLCPVFDFANHAWYRPTMEPLRAGKTENWQRSPSRKGNLDLVCVSCDRGIAQDQEVTLRYGWHSNRTLFVEYGFVNAIKSEELMSGVYPGEVNVQDIVTDLFDQQGDAGTFVKKTLDVEGYLGNWTLHTSPTPAHASFRLTTALRLYHTFPARPELGRAASEDDMNTASWRDTIMGYTEDISEANEKACRDTILEICRVVIERAENGLKYVKEEEEGEEWYSKCLGTVALLWREELWVAHAVRRGLS